MQRSLDPHFALSSNNAPRAGNMLSAPSHPYRLRLGNFLPKNRSSCSLRARSAQIFFFCSVSKGKAKDEGVRLDVMGEPLCVAFS